MLQKSMRELWRSHSEKLEEGKVMPILSLVTNTDLQVADRSESRCLGTKEFVKYETSGDEQEVVEH